VVSGYGREFGLGYVLDGPAELLLEGRVGSVGGRIRAGVDDIPDRPIDSFELRVDGGPKGDLVLSTDICARREPAEVRFTSSGGQVREEQVALAAECG
jgi:hypothetical protein